MCPKDCCSKTAKQVEFFEKAVEKIEAPLDLNKRGKDRIFLRHMRYLLLDDAYLRQLMRLQRWTRMIEENEENPSEDSEASSSEDNAVFSKKLKQDQDQIANVNDTEVVKTNTKSSNDSSLLKASIL